MGVGAEGDGLRQLTRRRCDDLAAIRWRAAVESHNVSVASGIAFTSPCASARAEGSSNFLRACDFFRFRVAKAAESDYNRMLSVLAAPE